MLSLLCSTSSTIMFSIMFALSTSIDATQPSSPPSSIFTTRMCQAIVIPHGYHCEEYHVTTEDGYILSLQRIPKDCNGRNEALGGGRPVVLQHGLTMDGTSWLLNSPDEALAFVLANNGFDVWISNTRGTRCSRNHTSLHPSSKDFWRWSWDELAAYDLPALINFVYSKTGQKLHYVGHSLGTMMALAALSERKLVDKFRSLALLCPVAYLNNITTSLLRTAAHQNLAQLARMVGIAEFNIKMSIIDNFVQEFCNTQAFDCYDIMTAITGENCCLNASTIANFLTYEPQSTSTNNLIHLSQVVKSGVMAKYDFENPLVNLVHYGSTRAPVYNLTNIPKVIPLFLSYGGHDALSDPMDVGLLLDRHLQSHKRDKLVVQFVEEFAHLDYIMAVNVTQVVYKPVISFFHRHQ